MLVLAYILMAGITAACRPQHEAQLKMMKSQLWHTCKNRIVIEARKDELANGVTAVLNCRLRNLTHIPCASDLADSVGHLGFSVRFPVAINWLYKSD